MPNNKKVKKLRDYDRHRAYYEAMKPVNTIVSVESIIKVLEDMWLTSPK